MPQHFIQDPTLPQGFSITFRQRFWAKVDKTDSCWIWNGYIRDNGYGEIQCGSRDAGLITSHRASWIIHNGPIPNGFWVLHDCPDGDNRACINPFHLWLGNSSENTCDALEKRFQKGNGHWCATMESETVREIRRLFEGGQYSQAEIARIFNVKPNAVQRIVRHKRWSFEVKVPKA